jgi:hypothetical protein
MKDALIKATQKRNKESNKWDNTVSEVIWDISEKLNKIYEWYDLDKLFYDHKDCFKPLMITQSRGFAK